MLQIATMDASPQCCSVREAAGDEFSHNAIMSKDDKNGGPNHLKAWREYRRLSQEQLGERVGTTASVISLLETGERGLSAKWLRRFAPALGITPGLLLDHDPNDLPTSILDAWAGVPEENREQALRVLETFRKAG